MNLWAAVAGIGTLLGLVVGLVRQWLRRRDLEGMLARSAEELADVRRKAAELARDKMARENRQRDRELRSRAAIHEIDGRTYESLRREPATALEMENEARKALEDARALADAFGDGSLGPAIRSDEDPEP